MNLYHATLCELPLNEPIVANQPTSHYPNVVAQLEATRPAAAPSRSVCLFAAESIAWAAAWNGMDKAAKFNVYEVDAQEFWPAPFALIDEISNRLSEGKPVACLLNEYWQPNLKWRFKEYFGPSFTPLAKCPTPTLIELSTVSLSYNCDMKQARSLP